MNALSAGWLYLKSEIDGLCWLKAVAVQNKKSSKTGECYRLSLMIHSQLSVGTSFNYQGFHNTVSKSRSSQGFFINGVLIPKMNVVSYPFLNAKYTEI